jgi:Amidohydrolase family
MPLLNGRPECRPEGAAAISLFLLLSSCAGDPARSPAPALAAASTASPNASATSAVHPSGTVRRTLVSLTRPSGSSVVTTADDGTITIVFDVLLNGRGPHTDATIRLARDGTIASLEAHGHHNVGARVDETFSIEGGRARWKSREETGEKTLAAPAFFVPIADLPDAFGWLAQALLKAGGTLPLLPAGQAHIEKAGEATVTSGAKQKHLTAYAITGLDLVPTPVWMEDDGTWFGVVDPWWSLVPEGWESAIVALVEKQVQMARDRDRRIAQRLAHKSPAAGLALTHARVLDVERGKWLADQTLVVIGEVIASAGPYETTKVPAGAETIDVAGKAVLPGLWDMHAHLTDADGALDVASGVTTVRDVGNDPDRLDDWKKRFDDGTAVGPHVLRAGFIEGRGPKAASSTITAETEAEAKAGVEFYAKRGYEMMKIYNSIKPELVPVITKEAHARGMTVTGHIPVHMLAHEAVKAGYDGIEHVNMLFLNFLADHDTDTRTPLRFSIVAEKAADLDLKSKEAQDFFALLRQHHTVIDPTLDAFEDLIVGRQGKITPGLEWVAQRVPVQPARSFLTGGLPEQEGKEELHGRSFEKVLQMVKALYEAKVTTVVGTDTIAGLMFDHELELFVRAGLSAADAIRDATIVAARAMKVGAKTGTIAAGKAADLFVVDGDPIANIGDVRRVTFTVRGGIVFPSKELFETVGVRYWQ